MQPSSKNLPLFLVIFSLLLNGAVPAFAIMVHGENHSAMNRPLPILNQQTLMARSGFVSGGWRSRRLTTGLYKAAHLLVPPKMSSAELPHWTSWVLPVIALFAIVSADSAPEETTDPELPQAVFFDLDGTLVELGVVMDELFGEFYWNIQHNRSPSGTGEHQWRQDLSAQELEEGIKFLAETRGLMLPIQLGMIGERWHGTAWDASQIRPLFNHFSKRAVEEYKAGRLPPAMRGALQVLQELSAKNIPLYILTGTPQDAVPWVTDAYGYTPYFTELIGTTMPAEGPLLSKADEIRLRVKANGWDPKRIVVVGDGPADMDAAWELGARGVGIGRDRTHAVSLRKSGTTAAILFGFEKTDLAVETITRHDRTSAHKHLLNRHLTKAA